MPTRAPVGIGRNRALCDLPSTGNKAPFGEYLPRREWTSNHQRTNRDENPRRDIASVRRLDGQRSQCRSHQRKKEPVATTACRVPARAVSKRQPSPIIFAVFSIHVIMDIDAAFSDKTHSVSGNPSNCLAYECFESLVTGNLVSQRCNLNYGLHA